MCMHICVCMRVCVTHTEEPTSVSPLVFLSCCLPNKQPTEFQCLLQSAATSGKCCSRGPEARTGSAVKRSPCSLPPACRARVQLGFRSAFCRQGWYVHHKL